MVRSDGVNRVHRAHGLDRYNRNDRAIWLDGMDRSCDNGMDGIYGSDGSEHRPDRVDRSGRHTRHCF